MYNEETWVLQTENQVEMVTWSQFFRRVLSARPWAMSHATSRSQPSFPLALDLPRCSNFHPWSAILSEKISQEVPCCSIVVAVTSQEGKDLAKEDLEDYHDRKSQKELTAFSSVTDVQCQPSEGL